MEARPAALTPQKARQLQEETVTRASCKTNRSPGTEKVQSPRGHNGQEALIRALPSSPSLPTLPIPGKPGIWFDLHPRSTFLRGLQRLQQDVSSRSEGGGCWVGVVASGSKPPLWEELCNQGGGRYQERATTRAREDSEAQPPACQSLLGADRVQIKQSFSLCFS